MADRSQPTALQICNLCGVDPARYERWIKRALETYATDRSDQVPKTAKALATLLPLDAEGFERAIVLGVALGVSIARKAA